MAKSKGTEVEVDGIKVTVAIDPDDDYAVVEASFTTNDPDASPLEKTRATIGLYHLLLGDEYDRVMGELRERNEGKLPTGAVIEFMRRVMSVSRAAKNS